MMTWKNKLKNLNTLSSDSKDTWYNKTNISLKKEFTDTSYEW